MVSRDHHLRDHLSIESAPTRRDDFCTAFTIYAACVATRDLGYVPHSRETIAGRALRARLSRARRARGPRRENTLLCVFFLSLKKKRPLFFDQREESQKSLLRLLKKRPVPERQVTASGL